MHAKGVVRQHSVLRRVPRRVLGRVLRRGPAMGFTVKRVLKRVLRRGSEKEVSGRCLERPLGEYAPLGVHPKFCSRNQCCPKNRREDRYSLAIFDRKEVAHLGESKT